MNLLMAVLGITAILVFIHLFRKKFSLLKEGRPEELRNYPEKRISLLLKTVFSHRLIFRDAYAGIMHVLLFWGGLVLGVLCLIFFLEHNITGPVWNNYFIQGPVYSVLSFAGDLAGLMMLAGFIMAGFRRYVSRPVRLHTSAADGIFLLSGILLILSGFLTEGLRIAADGFPDCDSASFAGRAAALLFSGIYDGTLIVMFRGMWWFHMFLGFLFTVSMAGGRAGHIIMVPLSIYCSRLTQMDFRTKNSVPFLSNDTAAEEISSVQTWKDRLDLDACTGCGRCQDACPAWITGKNLSPMKLMKQLKHHMKKGTGTYLEQNIMECTDCGACTEVCPVMADPLRSVRNIRRQQVRQGLSVSSSSVLENLRNTGTPYGTPDADYYQWLTEMRSRGAGFMSEVSEPEYLLFPGSSPVYNNEARSSLLALAGILQETRTSFVLPDKVHMDSGDLALRLGDTDLFRQIASANIETFRKAGTAKIICTSPHDFTALIKEYPLADSSFRGVKIIHHTELILDLIRKNKIILQKIVDKNVLWHDSCFLGRYSGLYDVPRKILASVPGIMTVEAEKTGAVTMCCGSGGGIIQEPDTSDNGIMAFKAREIMFSGADTVCTGCPFCKKMFSEGLKEMKISSINTADISEIIFDAMEKSSHIC